MAKLDGLNQIEEKLLDRELEELSAELKRIGGLLVAAFDKYPAIKGKHSAELSEYLVEHVVKARVSYCAGHVTSPQINSHPVHVPEALQRVILDWATEDFLAMVREVSEIASRDE